MEFRLIYHWKMTHIEHGPRGAKILVTNCKDCGIEVRRNAGMVGDGRHLRCKACRDALPETNWNGYPIIFVDGKYHLRHRVEMAKKLGRKLRRNELVHHKNEDKGDYSRKNLQLVDAKTHRNIHSNPDNLSWNLNKAKKLLAEGYSFRAIGRRLGVQAMTIYLYFVAHGLYTKGTRCKSHRGPQP